MNEDWIKMMIILAGVGQLVLVAASLAIPKCLEWSKSLASLPQLLRQLFWTYGGYILGMHLFFGVISAFGSGALIDGSIQSIWLTILMTVWWGTRLILQFVCFDRTGIPQTPFNRIAEVLLVMLFLGLVIIYGAAIYHNWVG